MTPCTVSVEVETPSILAPIWPRRSQRSVISGSRATLSMTVVPSASTAAISRFSVAPTLGKSSQRLAPRSRWDTSATTNPCSIRTSAPRSIRPLMCMSRPREPMLSPPGSATRARPRRATSGPSTQMEARSRRTRSYGASDPTSSGTSMTTLPAPAPSALGWSTTTVQPSSSSSRAITCTSRMSGTFVIVVRPGASNEAAISLSTLFFAPPTNAVPRRGRVSGPSDRTWKPCIVADATGSRGPEAADGVEARGTLGAAGLEGGRPP